MQSVSGAVRPLVDVAVTLDGCPRALAFVSLSVCGFIVCLSVYGPVRLLAARGRASHIYTRFPSSPIGTEIDFASFRLLSHAGGNWWEKTSRFLLDRFSERDTPGPST